jgi:ribosomal protein S27E
MQFQLTHTLYLFSIVYADPVDLVVSGTSCEHCFHKACIFAWLDKHDHCPYCREEMITPVQMKVAAKKVLSVERMAQLGPKKKTRESSLAPAAVLVDDVEAQAAMG